MEAVKVFLTPPDVASPSLSRVADNLTRYAPDTVEIVSQEAAADIVVLHVIGRQDQIKEKAKTLKKYAIIQYALRSTMRPSTIGWLDVWRDAELVWSYYDLPSLCLHDGVDDGVASDFSFYHAPLGIDEGFRKRTDTKKYQILTSGQSYLTESVRECIQATTDPVAHLGSASDIPEGLNVFQFSGITDRELSELYSKSRYVSGLRRVEGFELPVIEGLVCGARPICFDQPHYRHWFDEFAIFIPELPRDETVEALKTVFSQEYRPVTQTEIQRARAKFDWTIICKRFWKELLCN